MTVLAPPVAGTGDARLAAFCDPKGPEVFSTIVHGCQIWAPDPFDIASIHADARAAFAGLLARAAGPTPPPFGKLLLLLGEAGSGKTHLMRAFRNETHASATGYCGYLQMTTRADNYARYVLSNLIDALEQPYQQPHPGSGLTRLARGLLDSLDILAPEERERLCNDILEPDERARLVHQIADLAVQDPRFANVDLDLIRAMLYLLSNDGRIRPRILKWLRCEDLSDYDRGLIGHLVPRPQQEMPLRTIAGLGKLMAAAHQAALVLCVDQLEETIDQLRGEADERWQPLRQAVNTFVDITDAVPTCVVVVACLEDLFSAARPWLPRAKLDRLERDPEPIRLVSQRNPDEIAGMISRRLEMLYDSLHVDSGAPGDIYPYRQTHLDRLTDRRTRDVLDYCQQHQQQCRRGGWVEPGTAQPAALPSTPVNIHLDQEWNDFRATFRSPTLDDEPSRARLLALTVHKLSAEMPAGVHFGAEAGDRFVPVEIHRPGNAVDRLLIAVCDRKAQGGGLKKQVEEVVKQAGETQAVIVRSTGFPTTPRSDICNLLARLTLPKGRWRKSVIEESDWRMMAAFEAFHGKHHAQPNFAAWQRTGQPLSSVASLRVILALDQLQTALPLAPEPTAAADAGPARAVIPAPAPPPTVSNATLHLGVTRGMNPEPVTLQARELTQHAAFLGGSGSGKTTVALALIEQLLALGVPAVLIDRKGDLCRYADPDAWTAPVPDAALAERRSRLRERIDVALFTPGSPAGRALALPVVPADLGQLPSAEREQLAGFAANALASMMGYRIRGNDPKVAILAKAIEVLAAVPGRAVTVGALKELVADRDDTLLAAVNGYADRHYQTLAENLLTLLLQRKHLLDGATGETLDLNHLLSRGDHACPGRTRLSIINTQFLGDNAAVDFWLSQFLVAIDRWASKNPSPDALQAVFLFDEADQYLPATRQPATKAPMENLLRRARSKGIGIFLATQSPGDLDYKCRDQIRTWLVGRVKEKTAIDKLRPMLDAGRVDAATKLPGQTVGQFYLLREKSVLPVQVDPCAIATAQVPEDRILQIAETARR